MSGYLKKPENFQSESGREFNYINFLKKDNIFYVIDWAKIEKTGEGSGNFIKRNLFKLKRSFLDRTKKFLPEPHSSFLGGLILGAKDSMGSELQEDFRKTGVIHIVVLSGFNVTIVADFIVKFFSFLGMAWSGIFGGISIVLFAIMTGASATIIRASIMAILVITARLTSRYSEITRALFLAAIMMLLFNPMLLVYDPSFQLSFLASLGLIKLSPYIENKTRFIPEEFGLRTLFAATVATQIYVLPLLVWLVGEVSLISPLVNLLILVIVPSVMLFGFLMNIVSFMSFDIAFLISSPVYFMLDYALKVVEYFSLLKYSFISSIYLPIWIAGLIYVGYFFLFVLMSRKNRG